MTELVGKLFLLIGLVISAVWIPEADALTKRNGSTQVTGHSHVEIAGPWETSPAGDVNGDGLSDILLMRGTLSEKDSPGRVWVVFGSRDSTALNAVDLGRRGFLIQGPRPGADAAHAVGVGDVDGDGLDDVAIGAPGAGSPLRSHAGITYIVYGKKNTQTVSLREFDLNIQGSQGFRIDGYVEYGLSGQSVAPAGDMNGDGLADIIIGAPFAGASYVVFGQRRYLPLDLLAFHAGVEEPPGFIVRTPKLPDLSFSYTVDGGYDVNGDSVPDLMVAVGPPVKKVYVAFGKSDTKSIDASKPGNAGYVLTGGGVYASHAAFVGDVNGDGLADLITGVGHRRGEVRFMVAFGRKRARTLNLQELGDTGFPIHEDDPSTRSSVGGRPSVGAAGDLDEDGLDDILIGRSKSSYKNQLQVGSLYVIYGKRSSYPVRLALLGRAGYRIDGTSRKQFFGQDPRGVGDFNGDGLPDLVVGASSLSSSSSRSFVVLGSQRKRE
jgi:hypothetical protein